MYKKQNRRWSIFECCSYFNYWFSWCIILLLFASCSNPLATPTARVSSAPASKPASALARLDIPGIMAGAMRQTPLAKMQQILQNMSLDQKLGQLIVVEYLGNDYQASGLQSMVAQYYVGGFMYQESNHNFDSPYDVASQVKVFSEQVMKDASIPLLIATDQEGGLVNRLYKFHGYLPSAQEMAASGKPQVAQYQGAQAAKWMKDLGINTDLAPVVDVQTVDPPVLTSRMFGSDPQTVATYAGAYLDGLQKNGIAGTLKHFPGLGAITSDPHTGLPTVDRSKEDLEKTDLAPYKILIQQDSPAMIMSTDVLMPAIDPVLPAELSPKAIDGVLRSELGYNGVVITDGLYMGGISERWNLSQAATLSIIAGNDLIEGPFTPDQIATVVTALKQALQQGELSIDRIDLSVSRILWMKMQYGIIT
ncbi:MAG TPA: glycoside hydrolase family 3 N-terminal domain-containing protein [Ktedonobacteraceae bacterium]|nr:glycoside hydrolase family 3 N-terminal domain-containing protein [Ktedonobacteraceae bacterium]